MVFITIKGVECFAQSEGFNWFQLYLFGKSDTLFHHLLPISLNWVYKDIVYISTKLLSG